MTGSLQIKNDKYYAVINIPDYSGKRAKQKWISTGYTVKGNKKKAEQFLREKLQEYERQSGLIRTDMLFSDAVREWLKASELRIDAVTMQGYKSLAEKHILPYFDALKVKLIDIDRKLLQKYIDEKYHHGRLDGKGGLSPASMKLHKNILYQTLKAAVRDNLIHKNPCEFVTLPQMQRHDSNFYTAEKLNEFLEAIKEEPIYPMIKITSVYGLRRSELVGLKWDSVDFERNTLTIRHTVVKVSETIEKDKTKNASSYRSFPLTDEIKAILLNIKELEKQNRKLFGKEYFESDYIFRWDNGVPISPDYVSHKFKKLLKEKGFPHIRFHELRHSCASMLITMGFTLKDVQEWLGHSDIKMTANIYSHIDVTRKKGIADTISAALNAK